MMKEIKKLVLFCLLVILLVGCGNTFNETTENYSSQKNNEIESVDDLKQTENFRKHALAHIFEGEINRKGQAVGFHYEGFPTAKGKVINDSRTKENKVGVYEARVEISDIEKLSNQGKSSFFPNEFDAQKIVEEINIAYELKEHITGNTYEGLSNEEIVIRMYLDDRNKIISAYPIY